MANKYYKLESREESIAQDKIPNKRPDLKVTIFGIYYK